MPWIGFLCLIVLILQVLRRDWKSHFRLTYFLSALLVVVFMIRFLFWEKSAGLVFDGFFICALFMEILLVQIGQNVFYGVLNLKDYLNLKRFPKMSLEMQEIANALEKLAAQKNGALVILQRKDALTSYTKRGLKFDSEVKTDILLSLFHPHSPLHDGALIIHKGRISAARVILPLSTRTDVPMGFGTRHRSAIGITEKTDAIALIASEERGTLSIAAGGKLVPSKSREDFIYLLQAALKNKF